MVLPTAVLFIHVCHLDVLGVTSHSTVRVALRGMSSSSWVLDVPTAHTQMLSVIVGDALLDVAQQASRRMHEGTDSSECAQLRVAAKLCHRRSSRRVRVSLLVEHTTT